MWLLNIHGMHDEIHAKIKSHAQFQILDNKIGYIWIVMI